MIRERDPSPEAGAEVPFAPLEACCGYLISFAGRGGAFRTPPPPEINVKMFLKL
jgi:hypothetical protein